MSVLPYVLTNDILSQLPMKKIFQFRRVCKAWRHLLSGQDSEVLQSLKLRDTLVLSSPKEGGENVIHLVELEPGHENVIKFNYTNANLSNRSRLKLEGTDQYRVIRVTKKLSQSLCEIFTLGTNKWRNIPNIPFPVNTEYVGVPLNGAIHWIAGYEIPAMSSELICAFDIDSEKVRPILPPPNFDDVRGEMMLGVLGGSLYICDNYFNVTNIDVWVMRIYGIEESWTKEFVIPRNSPDRILFWEIRPMMILMD
ncbi:hypothetical protein SO802_023336 [Lithocarpus litseifolius]|uniref:F-box domain-containing protein n=1 Tax=Lithocarpus litseifolius TaxID=425828 RepID=A0AAW2C850_9ROSI